MRFDIKRGNLFDSLAEDYDRFRPGYPRAIINELVALASLKSCSRLFEIGCGTGKATVYFASHGYLIDCVDPGKKLLGLAKENCRYWPQVSFRLGKFEEISVEAESYDLVYSAQAFHWVDPAVRMVKVASALKAGGSLALLQNYPGKEVDSTIETLSAAIQMESKGAMEPWDYFEDLSNLKDEIEDSGFFEAPTIVRHRWVQKYNAESYVGLFRTYSDFLSLPRKTQGRIAGRIMEIIEKNGGEVTRSYDSIILHAMRK